MSETPPRERSSEDLQLIERATAGDAAALRTLLERCGPQLSREMRGQIAPVWRSQIDADDVMQVTYLEAFLQLHTLLVRDAAGFYSWLRRIALNNLRDAIKELERKKRPNPSRRVDGPTSEESYVALVEALGATSATPSRDAARREIGGIIERTLERLPPDYRRVIRRCDLEGRDAGEVAAEMGRSPGAIHMLRARAHDRLRALLGSEADFFSRPA